MSRFLTRMVCGMAAFVLVSPLAMADPRPFTLSTDTYAIGKGLAEYEQYITWRNHTDDDPSYNRFDFRHEFEYGLADNFDVSIYLANWRYQDSDSFTGTHFDSFGGEGVFYFSNPVTDLIGSGLYAEFLAGPDFFEFEQKLLLQKDVGNWTFLYNFILETEIERGNTNNEVEGVLGQSFGVAYSISPSWIVGGELKAEWEFEDWDHHTDTTVYLGPVVSFRSKGPWWATLTPTIELTGNEDAAKFMTRLIVGYEF